MKKIFLAFFVLMTIATGAIADTLSIDTSGWTQEQKNLMQAAAISLLAQEGIDYQSVIVSKNGLEIDSPSDDIADILTSAKLKIEATQIIDVAEQNRQIDVTKETSKSNELKTNEISTLDIAEVDGKIDSLDSLADFKDLLKELLKYIKAKE